MKLVSAAHQRGVSKEEHDEWADMRGEQSTNGARQHWLGVRALTNMPRNRSSGNWAPYCLERGHWGVACSEIQRRCFCFRLSGSNIFSGRVHFANRRIRWYSWRWHWFLFDALAEAETNRGKVEDMVTVKMWKATPIQLKKCIADWMERYVDVLL